jgi:hypothetical protein
MRCDAHFGTSVSYYSCQPITDRVHDEVGSLIDTKRSHYIGAMYSYGVDAAIKMGGDLSIRFSVHDRLQDSKLTRT